MVNRVQMSTLSQSSGFQNSVRTYPTLPPFCPSDEELSTRTASFDFYVSRCYQGIIKPSLVISSSEDFGITQTVQKNLGLFAQPPPPDSRRTPKGVTLGRYPRKELFLLLGKPKSKYNRTGES